MSHLAGLAGSVAVGLIARTTAASAFPDRPVSIIVPWAAGGGTDTVGRTFAAGFEQELGVVVNVINCLGGGGRRSTRLTPTGLRWLRPRLFPKASTVRSSLRQRGLTRGPSYTKRSRLGASPPVCDELVEFEAFVREFAENAEAILQELNLARQ